MVVFASTSPIITIFESRTLAEKLKSWLFQASIRNCLNCVHNCDDHSLLDFKIRSSIHETFHISLHIENRSYKK